MKRKFKILISCLCLGMLFGCSDNFKYFKNKVSNIENYTYYTLTQEISNDKLLLYKKDTTVYLKETMKKIIVEEKNINDYDSSELYSVSVNEYYTNDDVLYYMNDGKWLEREIEYSNSIGINMDKKYFESYSFSSKDGKDIFDGKIKENKFVEFMGISLDGASDLSFHLEINKKGYVLLVRLSYISSYNNSVVVSLKPNYSYTLDFSLPVTE